MNKFVYITDLHYGAYPVCRKDDYNKSILSKLEYMLDEAFNRGCRLAIFGGDVFDRPNQTFSDMTALINLLNSYMGKFVFLSNKGNPTHDGNDKNSPIVFLDKTVPHFHLMPTNVGSYDFSLGRFKNDSMSLFYPYEPQKEADSTVYDGVTDKDIDYIFVNNVDKLSNILWHPQSKNDNLFIFTHHIITKEKVPYEHVLMEELAKKLYCFNTDGDMKKPVYEKIYVFVADYHPRQGIIPFEDYGVIFVAPGSVARRKYTKDNIEKVPSFAIVDWKNDIKVDLIELDKEKGEYETDIWNIPDNDKSVLNTELDMTDFKFQMDEFSEELDFKASWKKFAATINVSDEVAKELNERLFGGK